MIGLLLSATIGGCAIPDYHLPQGFSSTYYRHLQESQSVMQASATEPVVIETPRKSRFWDW